VLRLLGDDHQNVAGVGVAESVDSGSDDFSGVRASG
jgi:hypothetical protein